MIMKERRAKLWLASGIGLAAGTIAAGGTMAEVLALRALEEHVAAGIGRIYLGTCLSNSDMTRAYDALKTMGVVRPGDLHLIVTFLPITRRFARSMLVGSLMKQFGEALISYFESLEQSSVERDAA
jgi:hypothetical protein